VSSLEGVGSQAAQPLPTQRLWVWAQALLEERGPLITGSAAVLVFLLAWEFMLPLTGVSRFFLAPPSAVADAAVRLFSSGEIYPHLAVSAYEVGMGLGLAILVGVPLGVLMGRVQFARNVGEPFLMALYATPSVALLPLLIIWFGIGAGSKIVLIFLGAVFAIVVNTEVGVRSVEARLVETVRSFTGNGWHVLTKVELPWALPFILAGMRLAIGRAMIMMVVAEMIMSSRGLGFLIMKFGSSYDTASLLVGIAVVVATSTALTQLLRLLETRLTPWLATEER
jgi:ABC-type nitrate/sulfonate/bicarbonate transport system permease component